MLMRLGKSRKRLAIVSLLLISFILLAAGCGGGNSQTTGSGDGSSGAKQEKLNINIMGARPGGVWSVFTEGVAESVRKSNPGSIVTVEPGTVYSNTGMVDKGKVQFAVAYSLSAYQDYKAIVPGSKPMENIRSVSNMIPQNLFQFTVAQKTGLKTVADIKEKKYPLKLALDVKDGIADMILQTIFEAYGFTYKDLESWGGKVYYLQGGDVAFNMMADGRMDAVPDAVPAPAGDIAEASTTIKLTNLALSEDAIKYVTDKLKLSKGVIPKGAYNFQDADMTTVNTGVIVLVNKDVSDDVVYRVTKSIYQNFNYLYTVHAAYKDLNKDNMTVVGGLPLHPGAEKFYKEMGLLK